MAAIPPKTRRPPAVAALLAQGGRLREAGRIAEAVGPMMQAARAAPNDAAILHDLGLTLLEAGRAQDAVPVLRRAVAVMPRFAHAHWRLGAALERVRDPGGAMAAYRTAAELAPALGEAQYRLAELLEDTGRREEAAARFHRAAATAAGMGLRRMAQARALMLEERNAEARKALQQAVAADPTNAAALDLMGVMLSDAGEFHAAAKCFERALEKQPGMVGAYYDLVRCRRTQAGDPILGKMLAAREIRGIPDVAFIKLNLAIGKAYDDLGDPGAAMAAFDAADAVRRQIVRYDPDRGAQQIEALIRLFTPEVIARAEEFGSPDPTPIMIIGMPRSGTTLTEQIVSSHRDVTGGGELYFWQTRGPQMFHPGAEGPSEAFVRQAAADYVETLRALGPGAARVSDKMPFNFFWTGLIHMAFPNAAIVHCRRSPIDTAISIHQTYFTPNFPCPTGGEALVHYYRAYERLMDHWRAVLPAGRLLEIDYEALTADPEPQIRQLVERAGLPWDPACLTPESNDRLVKTPSKWQAKQPINRGSVDRWRRYEPWLGPLAELLTESQRSASA